MNDRPDQTEDGLLTWTLVLFLVALLVVGVGYALAGPLRLGVTP